MPGCKLPNEDHQAFHEAMAESQKAKKNDNLTVFSARQLVSDPSDDFIDDDPTATHDSPAVDPILDVSSATDVSSHQKPATKPASGLKPSKAKPNLRNRNCLLVICSNSLPTRI